MSVCKYSLIIIALLSTSACTTLNLPSYDDLLRTQTEQDGRACIRQNNIRGYGILDDDVVSVDASRAEGYFLITTLYQCQSLQTSFAAGFNGSFAELCGGGRDKIFTNEEACPIRSIFEFASREEAFAAFEMAEETRAELREQARTKD